MQGRGNFRKYPFRHHLHSAGWTLSVTAYAVPAPPKGGALGYTGNFAATAKGVPLGELAANEVSRLRGYLPARTLSASLRSAAPPKGELFTIFRQVEQNLPLSGEVASRSDDGEGSSPQRLFFLHRNVLLIMVY